MVLGLVEQHWDKFNYFILNCPTGVGKTYIGTSIANAVKNAYIITSTIQLQNQYENSWNKIINLKGRGNYQCNLNTEFSVDCAPCTVQSELIKECIAGRVCDYYNQRDRALSSPVMLTNPLYMLYSVHCGFASDESQISVPQGVKREVMIIDEAHNLETHLIQFSESKLNIAEMNEKFGLKCAGLNITEHLPHNYELVQTLQKLLIARSEYLKEKIEEEFPGLKGGISNVKSWAKGISKKVAEKANKLNRQLYEVDKVLQAVNIFFSTHESIEELSSRWLIHPNVIDQTLTLTPLKAYFLFDHYFGKLADKFVFMSATIGSCDQFCNELGIDKNKAYYVETDTPFKPEKSPIIAIPLLKMGYKDIDKSIPQMVAMVDEIMNEHQKERGIIHCATYKIQNELLLSSKLSRQNKLRLLSRDIHGGIKYNNQQLLEMHSKSKIASVLLSPSMMEGIDLYDDLSTFQIILKFPWASLMDPRVKAKSQIEPNWYSDKMWVSVMQASGRSTRHEEDSSVTYILDASFDYFYNTYRPFLPKWFKNRISILR
jgi:Rad3-related DNA helicase